MRSKSHSVLAQFRSFCYQNGATDIDQAIEYFAVFGGMGWRVDFSKSLESIIEEKVLVNYRYIHGDIAHVTQSNQTYHSLLSALAMGDRREHSAFRRAKVMREEGEDAIDFLIKSDMIVFDKSVEKPIDEKDAISDKLYFIKPFMRFWFSVISPYYKGIKSGDYKETKQRWLDIKSEFISATYNQLIMEYISLSLKDEFEGDSIVSIGSYWDRYTDIDILTKRKSGRLLACSCKFSKSKAGKSELTKLKENCERAKLDIDKYIIFSKNKFSNELKKEKSSNLQLITTKHLALLINDLSEKDLIEDGGKKY